MPPNLETVIVVHGFAGKRIWMMPLAARLRKRFRVIHWGYNSLSGTIAKHADDFLTALNRLADETKIHIVAHSMGAIVVRTAIKNKRIENLDRVVLLAPPNQGAPVASMASPVFGDVCKPIAELTTAPTSFVNSLPPDIGYTTGIIAGKYDWLVPPRYTKLPNVDDFVETSATHNSLLLSMATAKHAIDFLANGRFSPIR